MVISTTLSFILHVTMIRKLAGVSNPCHHHYMVLIKCLLQRWCYSELHIWEKVVTAVSPCFITEYKTFPVNSPPFAISWVYYRLTRQSNLHAQLQGFRETPMDFQRDFTGFSETLEFCETSRVSSGRLWNSRILQDFHKNPRVCTGFWKTLRIITGLSCGVCKNSSSLWKS